MQEHKLQDPMTPEEGNEWNTCLQRDEPGTDTPQWKTEMSAKVNLYQIWTSESATKEVAVLNDSIPMRSRGESEVNLQPNLNIDSMLQGEKAHQPLKAEPKRCKESGKELRQPSTRTKKAPEHFVIEILRTPKKRVPTPLEEKSQTSHKPMLGTSQEKAMLYPVGNSECVVDKQSLERPDQPPRKELAELHKHDATAA